MALPARIFLAVPALLAMPGPGMAAIRLPPLAGSMAGEVTPFENPALQLNWRIEASSPGAEQRIFEITANGDAGQARATLAIGRTGTEGSWHLHEAALELGSWFQALAERLGDAAGGFSVQGRLALNGEGRLVDSMPQGQLAATLTAGHARDAAGNWELSDIEGEGTVDLDGTGEAAIRSPAGRYGAWDLKDARLVLHVEPERRIRVSELSVAMLGGTVEVLPFTASLSPLQAEFTVRVTGLELSEVSELLPDTFSEAVGRLDGELSLSWDSVAGVQLGSGWLGLSAGTTASVRLAPVPGLITGEMPSTNPAFAPLQRVELGRTPLEVQVLRAVFTPKGDAEGRSATIRLQAEPADPMLLAPIILDINILGPLNELIQLGLSERLEF